MQRFVLCSYSILSVVYFIEGGFGFVGLLNRQEVCTVFLSYSIFQRLMNEPPKGLAKNKLTFFIFEPPECIPVDGKLILF